jgi:membrane protease YdiL (CAAX protease family)
VRQFLVTLSPRAEFATVVVGAFGYFILTTFLGLLVAPQPGEVVITDAHLSFLLIYELPIMAALIAFLRTRGWTLRQLGLEFAWSDVPVALALAAVSYVGLLAVWVVIAALFPRLAEATAGFDLTGAQFSLSAVIAVSIVNALFEELFVCGYVVAMLRQRADAWDAVSVSIAIRLLYHFYQGTAGVLSILPFALVLAYWYARTGRLWPVILAHLGWDLLALLPYVER